MTDLALILVVAAAVAHPSWNLLAKTARGDAAFVWLCTVANVVIWAPLSIALLATGNAALPLVGLLATLASGCLHTGYWLFLNRGYGRGDLSLIYPLARGSGALIASVVAIVALGERPSTPAAIGALIVVGAVLSLARSLFALPGSKPHTGYAWLTGLFIAGYTLWDSRAVGPLALSPFVFYWSVNVVNAALLTPNALRGGLTAQLVTKHRARAAAIGVLTTLSYVPVLYALKLDPVSFVAPAREVSVLFGAAMGIHILGEADARRRLLAAAAMALGIAALALA